MSERARFRYSAQEGVLELEGSEDFVSKHFEQLDDMVRTIGRHITAEKKAELSIQGSGQGNLPAADAGGSSGAAGGGDAAAANSIAKHPAFFSEINGKLKIVADVPGDNKKAQSTNLAILYCYGSSLMGEEQVKSKDIREVAKEHGCLDEGNFASIFADKTIFLSDGVKGGNKDIKLTQPGTKKAKELLGDV